jgi:FKBP-type peptidyl-prolyl cis-trans isomerase FkpA
MKFFKPTLVALALVAVVGCNEAAVEVQKAPVLETELQKTSLRLGCFNWYVHGT